MNMPDSSLPCRNRPRPRMGEEFVRLSSFVAINKLGIDKIIKKHDKHAAMLFRDVFPFFLQERALLHTHFFDAQVRRPGVSDGVGAFSPVVRPLGSGGGWDLLP